MLIRSNSGSHQVSHHTDFPILVPIRRAHTLYSGEPRLMRIMLGTASISAKVSASSLRHTRVLNSGTCVCLNEPTSSHFAMIGMIEAAVAAAITMGPDHSSANIRPCL